MKYFFMTFFMAGSVFAGTWYIDQTSPQDGPGTNWASAFHTIQSAVDAAAAGDDILITNGIYYPADTILITNAVTLSSINGSDMTVIDGQHSKRCLTLESGAEINGLTFRNGYSDGWAGGVYCRAGADSAVLNECIITDCTSVSNGGGAVLTGGTLNNCIITANAATGTAATGGGISVKWTGSLIGCTVSSNSATEGGGIYLWAYVRKPIRNCSITGNSAIRGGGIANADGFEHYEEPFENCTISQNTAEFGGGVYFRHSPVNPILLANSLIVSNTAKYGAGAYLDGGTLNHCTVADNILSFFTGSRAGVANVNGSVSNSILRYNWNWNKTAESNFSPLDPGTFTHCCTVPLAGTGCITNAPGFLATGSYRLPTHSPCIDAGVSGGGIISDMDGIPRPLDGDHNGSALPDIGAYEHVSPVADSDGDMLLDSRELYVLGTSPILSNTDGDPADDYQEYVADTDGTDPYDWFRILSISSNTVTFSSSSNRLYSLLQNTNLAAGSWIDVPGQTGMPGSGSQQSLTGPAIAGPLIFYTIRVEMIP